MLTWDLWVDDVREPPNEYYWLHLRTVKDVIRLFEVELAGNMNMIDIISLDHDAGEYANEGGDYIKILDWLEEHWPDCSHVFHIHSMNSVGAQNMKQIIDKNGWAYIETLL